MGKDKVRYFKTIPNRNGGVRCYWQPSAALEAEGWRYATLPDPPEAFAHLPTGEKIAEAQRQAIAINQRLDAWYKTRAAGPLTGEAKLRRGKGTAQRGTVAALLDAYRESKFFREKLKPNTRQSYRLSLAYIEKWLGPVPVRAVFAKDVRQRYEAIAAKAPAAAALHMRVGRAAFGKAHLLFYPHDPEFIPKHANPFASLDIEGTENTAVIYGRPLIDWLIAAADMLEWWSMGDAIEFGYWFGQNPADVIDLPANLLERSPLEIRRGKTGRRCIFPIHKVPELVARIQAGKKRRENLGVAPVTWLHHEGTLRKYKRDNFTHRIAAVRELAHCLAAVAGDAAIANAIASFEYTKLRHTGITAMAAHCTKYEIQQVFGHSLATIDAVLEKHYLAPNVAAAEFAIEKRVKGEGAR